MRSINLTSIPKRGKNYDWIKSIGCICHVIYDEHEFDVMITKVSATSPRKITFISNSEFIKEPCTMPLSSFCKVKFSTLFISKYIYGDIVDGKFFINNVINGDNGGRFGAKYEIMCLKCGHKRFSSVQNFENGKNKCPCCDMNWIIKKGINDVNTTHPHLTKYFLNIEDSYKYCYCSQNEIDTICPDCGNIKRMPVYILSQTKYSCNSCGDTQSFPNRLMFNLLKSLGIGFEAEYTPEWIGKKRYDFFIPSKKLIIEMDGIYHYLNLKENLSTANKNDSYKDEQAANHGLRVIRINSCYKKITERFDYMYNSIIESGIFDIINISPYDVDWKSVEIASLEKKLKLTCKMKKDDANTSTSDVMNAFGIDNATAVQYLKVGNRLGLCHYDPQEEIEKRRKITSKNVICLETGMIYMNAKECGEKTKLGEAIISAVCGGKVKMRGDLHFKFLCDLTEEEFIKYGCQKWLRNNGLLEIFIEKNRRLASYIQ